MESQAIAGSQLTNNQEIEVHFEFKNIADETIKELAKKKNKNLKEISRETKIAYSTLFGWANGLSKPSGKSNIKKLALYFGVSLDYLLYGIGGDGDADEQEAV